MWDMRNGFNLRVGAGFHPRPQWNPIAGRHGGLPLQLIVLLFLESVLFAVVSSDDAFFPWATGTAWVYDTLDKTNSEHFEMKVVMQGPWEEGGSSGMIMAQKDKRGTMREFQLKNENGIFIQKLGLSKAYTPEVTTRFTPPVPRVIFPLVPGTKVHWQGQLKVAWVNKPIIFDGEVLGWEDISVPAGKFHCIKLHYHEKRGDDIIDEDAWYAEGVGQVKYDGGQYVKELKSYKIGSAP
jgi:hypothetical protein